MQGGQDLVVDLNAVLLVPIELVGYAGNMLGTILLSPNWMRIVSTDKGGEFSPKDRHKQEKNHYLISE